MKAKIKTILASYSDYPEAVSNNAKRGIELNDKVGNKCATQVGKVRAQQLAQGKPVTEDTIKRMASFLSRAAEYYDESDTKACGTISYLLWGGKAGLRWAESKIKEFKLASQKISDELAIINDRLAYSTQRAAEEAAKDIGCEGFHTHDFMGQTWYMPCKEHKLAEIGERGGIKRSKKAPKSDTANPNPKRGSDKNKPGAAATTRGLKVPEKAEKALQKKADDFNERYKEKLGYGVTIAMLRAVYLRGVGAFQTSHSPAVKSQEQWAQARVNAFLYIVRTGRPENKKYTGDFDLLPSKHPKSPKNKK